MLRMVACDSGGRGPIRRIALQQRDPCAFPRNVRCRGHGDADFGGGERRRVVDAIAAIATIRPVFCSFATTALF